MEDQEKQEAREFVGRGARQIRHAAKNGIRAADTVAEAFADDIEEGAEKVAQASKRLSPGGIAFLTSEMGMGFLGTTVAIAASVFAANRFKSALGARKTVIK